MEGLCILSALILLEQDFYENYFIPDSAIACSYQAPLSYDAWRSQHASPYNNGVSPPHRLLAYDNVPRNIVYDNAPPPGKLSLTWTFFVFHKFFRL